MKICVFGLWHLGLVTSACLSKLGNTVVGLDFNEDIINSLNSVKTPISEPGLETAIQENIQNNRLSFTYEPDIAFKDIDILWIAFDTPVDENDNADIDYIEINFRKIAKYIPSNTKIIISSQVPVGFTAKLNEIYEENHTNKCYFSYSPENLRLGKAIEIFLNPDRIIIGTRYGERELFLPLFSSISDRLEWMSIESAEMTKHAINAFLATSICFANEIASLCEKVGADAKEVERGLKTESRIGIKAYLNPGNAYSGGTLARDIRFLQNLGLQNNLPNYLLNSVSESNDFQKNWIKRKCIEIFGDLTGKKMSVLGLTYKAGTNTLRRSLSVELCNWLYIQGAEVTAFDPSINQLPHELKHIFRLSPDILSSIQNADCIIISTEWPVFQTINDNIKAIMRERNVIDPNGFLGNLLLNKQKIRYYAVGRKY